MGSAGRGLRRNGWEEREGAWAGADGKRTGRGLSRSGWVKSGKTHGPERMGKGREGAWAETYGGRVEKDHIRMDEGKDAQQFGMSVFWRPSVSDILFRIHGIHAFFSSVLGNQVNGPGIIQPGIISGPFIIRASDGKGDGPCIPAFFIGP